MAGLTPLLVLLAALAPLVLADPVERLYPYLLLLGAVAMLYLAYAQYEDPARHLLRVRPHDAADYPPLPASPTVSLIAVVQNDPTGAATMATAMAATDSGPVEIIIVNNGSTDGTGEELDRLAQELPITVLQLTTPLEYRAAMRFAAEHATGDLLGLVGSGTLIAADAVRRCVRALTRHPELGAVTAHVRARNSADNLLTHAQDAWLEARCRITIGAEASTGAVTRLPAGLAVCRRDAISDRLADWSASRPLATLLLRPRADGPHWQVGYVASARAYVPVPASVPAFLRRHLYGYLGALRTVPFTAAVLRSRGVGPALLYYARAVNAAITPAAALWYLLGAPLRGDWLSAILYVIAALISGAAYGLAAGIERPRLGGWAGQPAARLLGVFLHALLPAYAVTHATSRAITRAATAWTARRTPRPA